MGFVSACYGFFFAWSICTNGSTLALNKNQFFLPEIFYMYFYRGYKQSQYCVKRGGELRNNHEMAEAWSFFSKQHPHPRRQSKRTSPMLFTRNKVLEQYTLMPYLQFCVWFVIIYLIIKAKDQMKRRKIHYCAVWRSALHKSLNSTPFLRLTERCLWVSLWPFLFDFVQ